MSLTFSRFALKNRGFVWLLYFDLLVFEVLSSDPFRYWKGFSTSWGVFSLEHGVNHRGLRTQTNAITEVANYPLHLGGVKQWLKEDLLNSSIPWLGLESGTSASAIRPFNHLATAPTVPEKK